MAPFAHFKKVMKTLFLMEGGSLIQDVGLFITFVETTFVYLNEIKFLSNLMNFGQTLGCILTMFEKF